MVGFLSHIKTSYIYVEKFNRHSKLSSKDENKITFSVGGSNGFFLAVMQQ